MAANNIYIQVDFNSQNAQANVNALNQQIANTGPAAEKSSKQATSGMNSIGISIQNVNKEFTQLATVVAGLGIAKAVSGWIQLSAEMSRARIAQRAFTESAEQANEIFEQVRAIAAQSPFKFTELEETAQRMLVLGFNAKNVTDVLKAVVSQVTRMGGSVNEVNTIVNLFGRIIQKDFVGAMDLMRKLPAEGVPVIKALGEELRKQFNRPFDAEQVRRAIKEGVLDPMQTIRVIVASMKGDTSAMTNDAARAFKNLGDTINNALARLFGPEGFGPALTHLAQSITNLLAPLGGLLDFLIKLSPETKQMIVNWTAAALAIAAFGTALTIVTALTGPLRSLIVTMVQFTASLAMMNPEITIAVVALTALGVAAYKFIPAFKQAVDSLVGGALDKIRDKISGLSEAGKKFFADMLKPTVPIETGQISRTEEAFKKIRDEQQKLADSAQSTLLQSLASPVEAVQMKYATLFRELEKQIKDNLLDPVQEAAVRAILGAAKVADEAAAQFKETRRQMDEIARYQVERAKQTADLQAAYIEAQNVQDLRGKVRAIDQVAQLRVDAAQEVSRIEQGNLQNQFNQFEKMARRYRDQFEAAGVDVDDMVATHREEMVRRQGQVEQKQFDESQKVRLEGWKKANDVIIEDQKRVYEAFKDQFGQLFDLFTDKTKSLTQAFGDFFKKLALGEARQLFSAGVAGAATQAAGYGHPQESLARGGEGIVGILMRRGMPPRPPLPPPDIRQLPAAVTDISYDTTSAMQGSANRFEISTSAYQDSTVVFAEAVNKFASMQGEADRMVPGPTAAVSSAFESASQRTGVPANLLRAVAQQESGFNPRALGPVTRSGQRAMGLMQLMPGTAREHGVTDAYDPNQNVRGGSEHLSELLQKYKGNVPAALAAYNMGSAAYDRRMAKGKPLPAETQAYVRNVQAFWGAQTPPPVAPAAVAAAAGAPAAEIMAGQSTSSGMTGGADFDFVAPDAKFMRSGDVPGVGLGTAELANLPMQGTQMPANQGLAGIGAAVAPSLGKPGFDVGNFASGVASMAGMAVVSEGLKRRNSGMTVAGGALMGVGAASMLGFTALGGGLLGAGAGLFAAGVQRGGVTGTLMDIGGGALTGAMIGLRVGGPMGALIGAGIGAGVGLVTGLIRMKVKTEADRIRENIKQVYGVDITDRTVIASIKQIVDQTYGGNVAMGVRSVEVQEIVRLYALSTGQRANLPRPMYGVNMAQGGGALTTQPVYQNGQLVQSPYSGTTSTQYQRSGNVFVQMDPQQANDLFEGRVVNVLGNNPDAVGLAAATSSRSGASRDAQRTALMEPLTVVR